MDDKWGMFGDEDPCVHLLALRAWLEENFISIWAERAEQPPGWVNVKCSLCHRTYEVTLREPFEV